jgi:EAL domain-containing protein (putative c-di-GMP-specific phosphodiesterase class I)
MYAAKAAGKATSRRFHPDMHQQVQQDLSIRTELRRAVDRNEFILLYQPIVRVDTEEIVGFEALIRWEHPTRGLVSPDDFIPYAEQTGLIVPIGAWVVGEACTTAMVMRQVARREISMSVNVSPRQLQHDDVVDVVRTALMDSGLSADSLCLEITESVLANDIMLIDRLHSLRDLGLHIATSALASRRTATCNGCRSTRSRSIGPSSTGSGSTRPPPLLPAASSA